MYCRRGWCGFELEKQTKECMQELFWDTILNHYEDLIYYVSNIFFQFKHDTLLCRICKYQPRIVILYEILVREQALDVEYCV